MFTVMFYGQLIIFVIQNGSEVVSKLRVLINQIVSSTISPVKMGPIRKG